MIANLETNVKWKNGSTTILVESSFNNIVLRDNASICRPYPWDQMINIIEMKKKKNEKKKVFKLNN